MVLVTRPDTVVVLTVAEITFTLTTVIDRFATTGVAVTVRNVLAAQAVTAH